MSSRLVIMDDGVACWVDENLYVHREGELPAIVRPDGTRGWYVGGKQIKDEEHHYAYTGSVYKRLFLKLVDYTGSKIFVLVWMTPTSTTKPY